MRLFRKKDKPIQDIPEKTHSSVEWRSKRADLEMAKSAALRTQLGKLFPPPTNPLAEVFAEIGVKHNV